jgi:acetolactate synthase-1/2/3 large subunit
VTNTVEKFCPGAKIIHVDIDPTSISKTIMADIPIVGPVQSVLTDLIALTRAQQEQQPELPDTVAMEKWWQQIEQWRSTHGLWTGMRYEQGDEIKPQQVIESLCRVTRGEAYVTSDVGQHQMFAAQYYRFEHPRRWINSGGLGTMGFGLPAAMGVKLAFPDADVACVTGEGSIQMNIQELSTCSQYQVPVKIINLRNGYLGMVKQWQDMQYEGRHSESTYADSLPDFSKLAEAYGHVGILVENLSDLDAKMEEAFALKDKLVFLDVMVDPTEHVYPMHVAPNGTMADMWLSKTERT